MWCCCIRPVKGKKCNLLRCDWLNLVVDVEGRWIFRESWFFPSQWFSIWDTGYKYCQRTRVVLRSMSFWSLLWVWSHNKLWLLEFSAWIEDDFFGGCCYSSINRELQWWRLRNIWGVGSTSPFVRAGYMYLVVMFTWPFMKTKDPPYL